MGITSTSQNQARARHGRVCSEGVHLECPSGIVLHHHHHDGLVEGHSSRPITIFGPSPKHGSTVSRHGEGGGPLVAVPPESIFAGRPQGGGLRADIYGSRYVFALSRLLSIIIDTITAFQDIR